MFCSDIVQPDTCSDIKTQKFLHKQFASVRHFNLANLFFGFAIVAVSIVSKEATFSADVNSENV